MRAITAPVYDTQIVYQICTNSICKIINRSQEKLDNPLIVNQETKSRQNRN